MLKLGYKYTEVRVPEQRRNRQKFIFVKEGGHRVKTRKDLKRIIQEVLREKHRLRQQERDKQRKNKMEVNNKRIYQPGRVSKNYKGTSPNTKARRKGKSKQNGGDVLGHIGTRSPGHYNDY
tara:strand:- start:477 stop:839 length:363 start_codon:yes stop_codon:yes gene_type:complete